MSSDCMAIDFRISPMFPQATREKCGLRLGDLRCADKVEMRVSSDSSPVPPRQKQTPPEVFSLQNQLVGSFEVSVFEKCESEVRSTLSNDCRNMTRVRIPRSQGL